MQFLLFSTHPPRRKCNFCSFLLVRRGGQSMYSVVSLSSTDDGHFLPLFRVHPWMTNDFRQIQRFVDRQRAFFCDFCISSTDEGRFSSCFAFRRPTTSIFQRFLRFVGRRQTFSSDFRISSTDDERFPAISAFRRPTTGFLSVIPLI